MISSLSFSIPHPVSSKGTYRFRGSSGVAPVELRTDILPTDGHQNRAFLIHNCSADVRHFVKLLGFAG
jgi:hypothetical protein